MIDTGIQFKYNVIIASKNSKMCGSDTVTGSSGPARRCRCDDDEPVCPVTLLDDTPLVFFQLFCMF